MAKAGKDISTGGGEIGRATLEEYEMLDERQMREMIERCPGRCRAGLAVRRSWAAHGSGCNRVLGS